MYLIEAAFAIPVMITLLFGAADLGFVQLAKNQLTWVTQQSATCWGIGTTCHDAGSTQSYASDRANDSNISAATFEAQQVSCGYQVTATFNWTPIGYVIPPMTLTARACAPAPA